LHATLPPGVIASAALPGREHGATVQIAGLVVARQRPETAKGFVFVLLEDEAGMVNVIVRPDVYERFRVAIRGEPLLWVGGTLAKDDGTLNVLAEEVHGLKLRGQREEGGASRPPADQAATASASPSPSPSPFSFLKSLRRVAPESKDWG
jgi:DNA polymerase III alpha subunit